MSTMDSFKKKFEDYLENIGEVGFVQNTFHPIARIGGIPSVKVSEVVLFEGGEIGQVQSIEKDYIEVLILSKRPVRVGEKVARTAKPLEIPVGEEFLGHIIDVLGNPFNKFDLIKKPTIYKSIDSDPWGIDGRVVVNRPLETGVTVVDMLVPLGKGQRELVIGDRRTGRTNFILQTMLTQAKQNSVCIYAAVGKRRTDVQDVERFLSSNGVFNRTIIIASGASDSAGTIFLTPYSAMSMAEYFRDLGNDVLLVIDDLTTHAKYYREISLLAKRFPGRNSYPGDIFFTHSRLLERAGCFKHQNGEVAITCLPVAESIEGDISGYIQTNLMSMTDGHIYFDKDLFARGRRPAVNYFLSVTRVGRQTQSTLRWGINREMNAFLSLLEKTRSFVHFGVELNEAIQATLAMGDRIIEFLNQNMDQTLPINLQILMFSLIWLGTWTTKSTAELRRDLEKIAAHYRTDNQYKDKVDSFVSKSTDFNNLLGKLSQRQAEFM